jgi:hypothetical protein
VDSKINDYHSVGAKGYDVPILVVHQVFNRYRVSSFSSPEQGDGDKPRGDAIITQGPKAPQRPTSSAILDEHRRDRNKLSLQALPAIEVLSAPIHDAATTSNSGQRAPRC